MKANDHLAGDQQVRKKKLNAILARVDALPTLDERSEDEILCYDENGLPG